MWIFSHLLLYAYCDAKNAFTFLFVIFVLYFVSQIWSGTKMETDLNILFFFAVFGAFLCEAKGQSTFSAVTYFQDLKYLYTKMRSKGEWAQSAPIAYHHWMKENFVSVQNHMSYRTRQLPLKPKNIFAYLWRRADISTSANIRLIWILYTTKWNVIPCWRDPIPTQTCATKQYCKIISETNSRIQCFSPTPAKQLLHTISEMSSPSRVQLKDVRMVWPTFITFPMRTTWMRLVTLMLPLRGRSGLVLYSPTDSTSIVW